MLVLARAAMASTGPATVDECRAPSADCVAVRSWNFSVALGGGVRTNPVAASDDIPLVVIPHVSYYGKRVFLDNLDFGITLLERGAQTLSLVATPGYDRVFFYKSDLQNFFVEGLPTTAQSANVTGPAGVAQFPPRARQWTYLVGPEWTFKHRGVTGQLDVLHEVTGRNDGTEIRAAAGIPLFESHGSLTADVGFTWKSGAIVNYYYGQYGVYDADAAFSPFVKLGYKMPLGGRWQLTAFAHYERLGRSIADSPIVSEHYVATAFAGVAYSF